MGTYINVVIVMVVISTQGTTGAIVSYPCCNDSLDNSTECCLSESCTPFPYKNCSSLNPDYKTLATTDSTKCLLSTTVIPGLSTVTATTSDIVTSHTTRSIQSTTGDPLTTSEPEDEDFPSGGRTFTICVLECPKGFYEDQDQNCLMCDELCENCTLDGNDTKCLECKYGRNSTGQCCPTGTKASSGADNTTVCEPLPEPTTDDVDDDKLYIIIGCVAGAVAVIVTILLVVVCCCRRRRSEDQESGERPKRPVSQLLQDKIFRKKKNYEHAGGQLPSAEELRQVGRHPGAYENTATIDHRQIAIGAQQEQDKIGRYAKDPTGKKKRNQKTEDDEEPQEVYENQAIANFHAQQSQTKKKNPFNKLSKKFKSKKDQAHASKRKTKTPVAQAEAPTEEYEDVNPPAPTESAPLEAYEDLGPNAPQETYEGVEQSNDNGPPQEEYMAMDPNTQEPTEEYQAMDVQETNAGHQTQQGAVNPTFANENPYENFAYGPKSEDIYLNTGPEEDYQNYQGPQYK